ncbi:iron reductase domain protein [Aplosporella prunicola CBS 121167]|uniref:Iron reductase domain protein n=1 Tax=Aplosporella prunicola CBS 121167 TaxID=1176127 RepID=A0A6A6B2D3_9PEZI|nr:iron reductase domain protein [Aplosporella prunicola CBS 121167]KAF2137374.1 iron reductase domain protein [Aplosporella prunicola CBS 121167]
MRSVFTSVAAIAGVASAATAPYTDSTTGIKFSQYTDKSGYAFGMAVPETVGKDFIGQIVAPGEGWAGVSLTSSMMASTLIAAWPNGDDVIGSLRKTTTYTNPKALTGDAKLVPIAEGTSKNETHFTYTFLCQGCIVGDTSTFKADAKSAVLGWALADAAPTNPESADEAVLAYHKTGFGAYGLPMADAESADYETWAAMANGSGSSGSGSSAGASTPGASTPAAAASTPAAAASTPAAAASTPAEAPASSAEAPAATSAPAQGSVTTTTIIKTEAVTSTVYV